LLGLVASDIDDDAIWTAALQGFRLAAAAARDAEIEWLSSDYRSPQTALTSPHTAMTTPPGD
jgi:hypothetical protein